MHEMRYKHYPVYCRISDVNPLYLRIIMLIAQGILIMDLDLATLSSAELTLIKDCAKYLNSYSVEL
jgi:hypothetical protein